MIKNKFKTILLCLILSTPLSITAAPIDKLIVFGDSLSDNGNLASLPGFEFLNSPPYQGGFNNGKPAVVQLAKYLNLPLTPAYYFSGSVLGNNFAVAGARAAGNTVIDLTTQVAAFLGSGASNATNNTLYIIFIGGNDIRDMRNQKDEHLVHAILDKAANNIQYVLSQLVDSGATHFLVVNSPDIGKIPETRMLAMQQHDHDLIRQTSKKTAAFNAKLAETVKSVEQRKGVDIVLFDVNTFFNGIAGNGQAYLFSNVTQACFSSVFFDFYSNCSNSLLDSFVYFDEIHPSQRVHERVGRAMFSVTPEGN